VELSNEHKLGIDWGALASAGDLKGLSLTTNFASENISSGSMVTFSGRVNKEGAGDTASGVKAVLKALESFGRIEVVSQPRVMMLNNSVASIQVGETRSYVESTNMETTQGGATITSASLNEVHGGVTLQIVGSIAGEDIFLNVTPVVSTIDDIRTITLGGGSKLEAPDTSMKTMSTVVRVKAGHTVAIGGLITRDRSKHQYGIPFLSRLPVLGKAFSYELRRNNRTELVIFMTPRRG
jgi:type II secretory pathway component GspD/PulD (secretin)